MIDELEENQFANLEVLGIIFLKNITKPMTNELIEFLDKSSIKTWYLTGENAFYSMPIATQLKLFY